MYRHDDLRHRLTLTEGTVNCPVRDCDVVMRRRRRSDPVRDPRSFCRKHGIYVTPSTFEYADRYRNLLWSGPEDLRAIADVERHKRTWARMGRECDEDSLVWNVFRPGVEPLLSALKVGAGPIAATTAFWGVVVGQGPLAGLEQAQRSLQERSGAGTEPDLIVSIGTDVLVVVEAKFNSSHRTTASRWRDPNRPDSRPSGYGDSEHWSSVFTPDTTYDVLANRERVYQLMRMALVAAEMARQGPGFERAFLVSLTPADAHQGQWNKLRRHIQASGCPVEVRQLSWTTISNALGDTPEAQKVRSYLRAKSRGYRTGGQLRSPLAS